MSNNFPLQIDKNKRILDNLILLNAPYDKILKQSQKLDIYIAKHYTGELDFKKEK